jgi:hypothetical protein
LTSRVVKIEARLPGMIFGAGLILGWTLVWFGLVSIALIIQGRSFKMGVVNS